VRMREGFRNRLGCTERKGFRVRVLGIDRVAERERGFSVQGIHRVAKREREREREREESDFLRCNSLSATLSQLGDLRCE
jgi:hypothetical protein